MVKRALHNKVEGLAKKFPVVCIVGPRQSGKTTLAKAVFGRFAYVSLEDLDMREFALQDPRGFLSAYAKGGLIIDEAQRAPGLFSYLQTEIDKRNRPGQFILTGSQNILLQQNLSQTLAGRVAILQLFPFSLEELHNTKFELKTIEAYLVKGFYPRIYDKKIAPADWYPNYIRTYLERDARLIKDIGNLNTFQRFIKLCAGRTGQILNLSSLSNDCGVSHNTVKAWLSVLESTFIIFLLRPYYRSFNKRLVKMPKLYFYDTGLVCSLLGIKNISQLKTHYAFGALFESFVISEIIKVYSNRALEAACYFWRDKLGHEIDCILEAPNNLVQIEVKSGKTITDNFFAGLRYWKKIAGKRDTNPYIIYGGEETHKRIDAHIISWKDTPDILKSWM